ncbi:MAG: DASH family cryptochrome [Aureispira sp.]|nr:DASH family cryptochrome [Aureispira sp.]
MKKVKKIIVWFRQDLRLHDNEALAEAYKRAEEVIPVYVFDERQFSGKTTYGFAKTAKYRAKFIIEAVQDLKNSFQAKGIDLIVRRGKPEEEVFKLVEELKTSWVFANMERTAEEVEVQNALEKNLWTIGKELQFFRGKMLYYTQDLPFPITHAPDIFKLFRKELERFVMVREPLAEPSEFKPFSEKIEVGDLPKIEDFGHQPFEVDGRSVLDFRGGETAGLERLKYYLWDSDCVQQYENTRNGLLGADYSSKLSPWLALGCISPKHVYWELKAYEQKRKKNKSTYALFLELLWRDFFRLMGKKHGNKIFLKGGILERERKELNEDLAIFEQWATGQTGIPFIDANMLELNKTGFMSNRGRQNVASYLVNDLGINWQIGAEYFESLLVDYDVCSNWCNWNYIARVGTDPRDERYFNPLTQAKRYDPKGDYAKCWLPHLNGIPAEEIHEKSSRNDRNLQAH